MLKTALLFLCSVPLLPAQTATTASATLTDQEREFAVKHLQNSEKMFLESIAGLTPEQWNFKAGPDRWSIAECAEHITISEDFISGLVRDKIMQAPADPSKRSETKGKDELVVEKVPDRSRKFQAPEAITPKKRWPTPDVLVAHFKESRAASINFVETTQDDMRDHIAAHPAMGPLDAYQWILLMSAHTERHTAQINEVKADPKYPKP